MTISDRWTAFENRLAECLSALEERQFLTLTHPETHYYVQFAGGGARYGLRGEAVSNHYTAPRRRLGPDEERRLIELGWKAPTHDPEAEQPVAGGSPNWHQDWEQPVDWGTAAKVAGLTLPDVFGVADPRSLEYTGFEEGAGALVLPSLAIPRERSGKRRDLLRVEWFPELKREVELALFPWLQCFAIRRLEDGGLLTQSARATVVVRELENPFQVSRWTPEIRPSIDTAKPATTRIRPRLVKDLLRRQVTQVGLDLGAPAPRPALEDVGVMQQAIQ